MSRRNRNSDEATVPLSVVFITIGAILVMAVCLVWLLVPRTMPQPVYDLVSPYLPKRVVQMIPTRVETAVVPTAISAPILLPETPLDEDELPSYFFSAENIPTPVPGQGDPARIVIPAIELDAPVSTIGLVPIEKNGETYFQWQVPNEFQAGWHDNSAHLGQTGNTVLNGHHNVYGEVFRDLIDLEEGDEIALYDQYEQFNYRITDKKLLPETGQPLSVRLQNAQWIEPTDDERITLITCWPYTNNTHRLVIIAEPSDP